jgi:hypothetical protein
MPDVVAPPTSPANVVVDVPLVPAMPKSPSKYALALQNVGKPFIISISQDIEPADLLALQSYGKVLVYDEKVYMNIPIDSLQFDYLILDHRVKSARYALMRLKDADKYNSVLYCAIYELEDLSDDEHYDAVLTSFPARQALKADYDHLLLVNRLQKPIWYLSLLKCLYRTYQRNK